MSRSFFVPFTSFNNDGAQFTPAARWNDVVMLENYDEVIPGPNNTAMPRRSLSTVTTPALAGKCRGMHASRDKQARDIVLAGDSTHLYRAFSSITGTFTFSAIHSLSITMSTCATWEFASFEESPTSTNNFATNGSTPVLRSNFRRSVTMSFVALSGNIRARHLGVISRFLVLGNTSETTSATASDSPSRVYWSAFGNPASFTPSAATQSDYEDFPAGGAVQKITPGTEYGLVFQERQVQTMRYVGGNVIFDFNPINYAPGTNIPNSVLAYGGVVYYISPEGMLALNGLELKRIGNNIVDRYFWTTIEQTRLQDVSVAPDPVNKIIWWSYPTGVSGIANRMLGYKFDDGRWVKWEQDIETLGTLRPGLNVEKMCAFDSDHKLKTFTSNAFVTATFETKKLQPVPDRRWQCNGIKLHASGTGTMTTASVVARVYDTLHPSAQPSATTAVNMRANDNYFPMRTAGLYQAFTLSFNPGSATNTSYIGAEIFYELLGGR